MLSHYAAGNTGARKTRGNPGRAAVRPGPVPGPDIATDRSYYGSHRDRQLLRGGYDRTAAGACPAGHSVLPGEAGNRRDESGRDGYRAAGKAGRNRRGGTTVKAGAWRAGDADAPDGRQDPAGAIDVGQDSAGVLPQDRTWLGVYAWQVLGDAFILPGLKSVRA